MSPIDQIRNGIEKGDWDAVVEGFASLTGQRLVAPKPVAGRDRKAIDCLASVHALTARFMLDSQAVVTAPPAPSPAKASKGRGRPKKKAIETPLVLTGPTSYPDEEDEDFGPDEDLGPLKAWGKTTHDPEEPKAPPDPSTPSLDENERGRQLRELRYGPQPAHRVSLDDFRVENGTAQREDGRRGAQALPFVPGKNTFVDDLTINANEIESDRILTASITPTPPRPLVKKVKVTCVKCEKDFKVHPIEAPKSFGEGDKNQYVCDPCIKRPKRR